MESQPVESSQDIQAAKLAFDEAMLFRKLDLRPQAIESCRKALAWDQRHAEAWRLLASLTWQGGNHQDAVDLLTRAAATIPRNALVHADLGLARLAFNRPEDAVSALRQALELDPALAGAHQNLGIALKRLGRTAEAEAAYRKALQCDPPSALAYRDLGEILAGAGRLPEARASLESALQIEPRSLHALLLLGKTLLLLGDYPAAVDRYRAAAALDPDGAMTQLNLGIALRIAGDLDGSIAAMQRSIGCVPGDADAHAHLADALLQAGRYGEACESARTAVRLNPKLAAARMTLAAGLAAAGDLAGAAAEAGAAHPAGTPAAEVHFALGSMLADAGASDASLACFQNVLEFDPGNALARHLVAARTGANVERDPSGYVRGLFDSYADTFDEHLQRLGYETPQKLMDRVLAAATSSPPWECLDLGCGTGLFGVQLAGRARRLVGVDVSPKMIERCRELSLYTELRCADLLTALEGEVAASYDLVAAADVFVYVGRLDAIVPAVRSALRPGGIFAFSTEAAEHTAAGAEQLRQGVLPGIRGRFAHTAGYLKELAGRHDFHVTLIEESPIRIEGDRPVMGWLAVWTAGRSG